MAGVTSLSLIGAKQKLEAGRSSANQSHGKLPIQIKTLTTTNDACANTMAMDKKIASVKIA